MNESNKAFSLFIIIRIVRLLPDVGIGFILNISGFYFLFSAFFNQPKTFQNDLSVCPERTKPERKHNP